MTSLYVIVLMRFRDLDREQASFCNNLSSENLVNLLFYVYKILQSV